MEHLALLAALLALPAAAHEMDAVAKACSGGDVSLRLEADTSEGAAEREAARVKEGRSKDDQVADHLLRGQAEVARDAAGSTLSFKRKPGKAGEADCRRRLAAVAKRFPGRVSFMDPEKGGMKEAARRAQAKVPEGMRKTADEAALTFDSAAARAGSVAADAVPLPVPAPRREADTRPRADMPSSYNRPYSAPPAPLIGAALGAYNGGGKHVRTAGMAIDTDGDLRNADPALAALARRDPYRQAETSVRYKNGRSLDPTRVPYVVIPLGYTAARNGELVMVEYGGRSVLAVVGDRGPRHKFGEGSMALAVALGINPSGTSGGVGSGVKYTFLGQSVGSLASEADMLSAMREKSLALQASGLLARN